MPDIDNQDAHIGQQNIGSTVYNMYGDKKIPKHLTAPPFIPDVFVGREADLPAIKEKLFGEDNILLLVNGRGGVGKTSLAAQYYHSYGKDYQHLAWLLSEKSIAKALLRLARPMDVQFEDAMPDTERIEVLISTMANLTHPCLLVIDNANEIQDLKDNYQRLRRCKNFHLILTSRITEFKQAESYKIEGLALKESLTLFKKFYPHHKDEEDKLFADIHTAVWGNTLVIELIAKNLNNFNNN